MPGRTNLLPRVRGRWRISLPLARSAIALSAVAAVVTTQVIEPIGQAHAQDLSPSRPASAALATRAALAAAGLHLTGGSARSSAKRANLDLRNEATGSYRVSAATLRFLSHDLGLRIGGSRLLTGDRAGSKLTISVAGPTGLRFGLAGAMAKSLVPSFPRATLVVDEAADSVTLTASAEAPAHAKVTVAVAHASTTTLAGGRDLTGSVTLDAKLFGTTVSLAGPVTDAAGTAAVSLSGALSADAALEPGLVTLARGSTVTVTTAGGLHLAGRATLGLPGHQLRVAVAGAVSDPANWSLAVSRGSSHGALLPGLTLSSGAAGTVSDTRGAVRFDVHGHLAKAWATVPGVSVTSGTAEFADRLPAGSTAAPPAIVDQTPWADVTGDMRIAAGSGAAAATIAAHGTVAANLSTGAATLTAQSAPQTLTTSPVKTVLGTSDYGGRLTVESGAIKGKIRGTGHITLQPAHAAAVAADASVALTTAGTLVADFPADRSLLGLGQAGTVDTLYWASAATGFTTATGAHVQLPAGLSAATRGDAAAAITPVTGTPQSGASASPKISASTSPTPSASASPKTSSAARTAGAAAASTGAGTPSYTLSGPVYSFIENTLGIPVGSSPTVSGSLSGQTLTLTVGSPGPLPLSLPAASRPRRSAAQPSPSTSRPTRSRWTQVPRPG